MQLFFWFSIALLAFASFAYIILPSFVPVNGTDETSSNSFKKTSVFLSLLLIITSVSLYVFIGSPSKITPQETVNPNHKYSDIILQIETHLAKNPEDAEGWQVLAPAYLSLNQADKAFDAFANAIKFGNSTGQNWLGLGKSKLMMNKGVFGPMTKVAFTKAQEKLPDDVEAMYFYATMLQDRQEFEQARLAISAFLSSHELSEQQAEPLNQILKLLEASEMKK